MNPWPPEVGDPVLNPQGEAMEVDEIDSRGSTTLYLCSRERRTHTHYAWYYLSELRPDEVAA